MINISKSGNAIKFAFTDSDHYLYGNGEIEVPVNSLSLIVDESNMVTFRKANSNDIFLSFNPANSNLSDKEGVINFYKTNMVGSTGGGSESGITSGEVQTMIDESLEDYYDKDEVDSGFSTVNTAIAGKADTSAVTAVANDVSTLSGQVATKVATTDFNTYSAATDARLAEDEEVTAAALNDLQENKADTSSVTAAIDAAISGKADTSAVTAVNDALTAHTANTTVHVTSAEKTAWNAKQDALYIYTENRNTGTAELHSNNSSIIFNAGGTSITTDNPMGVNTFNVASTGVTINGENVATEPYVTSAISGKADTSAVTAVNDALTAHTSDTGIHVSAQEKNAWNAKAEPYSAGTGIDITDNVISATGGSSVTVDSTLDSGSTNPVANSAITAGINDAKAYYISFATIAQNGIHDADWDGIVAAIDDHRPIYAGYPRQDGGIIYYSVECMNKNVGNTEIVMTTSDDSQHYFYTFTKNGSNDYSYTVSTKPYVPDITTAITSGSTDAEIPTAKAVYDAIPTGGGATYSAGTNISIDTANTINCTLPITTGTGGYSLSIGNNGYGVSQVSGNYAVSVNGGGYHPNTVRGNNSFAANMDNQAIGEGSFANGQICIANGIFSHAEGAGCTANTYGSHAEGCYVITNNKYEHSQGKYNVSNSGSTESGQTLFSVGNGTSTSARHNAFEIRQNGDIYVNDGTNDVRLQDTILALGGLKLVKLTQAEYDQLATKDPDTLYIITNVVS